MRKTGYRILAYISLALGLAGVVLPLLPTTPFVLLAAWCASRSSPAFEAWLHGHPTFGPVIHNWRESRAVPVRAKWVAGLLLASSWTMLFLMGMPLVVLVMTGLFFSGVVTFLVTRPSV
ncbi:YbaN family protein [Marinobacter sp. OP 3.4]|uniref:YbaN family protein n=1 Tax=Marinobacter sp. OP 3.4 TaxID=3076501 RepID=UPI002E1FB8CA